MNAGASSRRAVERGLTRDRRRCDPRRRSHGLARIGIIREGRLHQAGRPEDLTAHPADAFVAGLTGSNLLHGTADGLHVTLDDGTIEPAHGRVGIRRPLGDRAESRSAPSPPTASAPASASARSSPGRLTACNAETRVSRILRGRHARHRSRRTA